MFIVDKAVSGVGASYLQDVMCTQAFNLMDGKVAHGSLKYVENDDIQDVFSTLNSRQSVKIYDNIKNGCEKWYSQTLLDAVEKNNRDREQEKAPFHVFPVIESHWCCES